MPQVPKLRRHPSGNYYTQAGGGRYFGKNKKQAEGLFREYLAELRNPRRKTTNLSVVEVCAAFLNQYQAAPATIAQRKWGCRYWCEWHWEPDRSNGDRDANDVTLEDFNRWVDWLENVKGLSPESINHCVRSAKQTWEWAANRKPRLLDGNALADAKAFPIPQRVPEYLHRQIVAKLLWNARRDPVEIQLKRKKRPIKKPKGKRKRPSENPMRQFATVLRMAYHTGMRLGEHAMLDWVHVDLGLRQIRFETHKTSRTTQRARIVHLDATAIRILLRSPYREGPVFRNRWGEPWKPEALTLRFRRLRDALGIDRQFRVTSFRHTVASDHLRAGQSTKMVADLLGHKSTRMVEQVYGHLLRQDHEEAVREREEFRRKDRLRKTTT